MDRARKSPRFVISLGDLRSVVIHAFADYWIPARHEGLDLSDGDRERLACAQIQAELSKLGIHLGLTTISRYLPKVDVGGNPHQRWMTFLRNHRDVIAGMDFFVVPTVRFTLLYVGSCSTTEDGVSSTSTSLDIRRLGG